MIFIKHKRIVNILQLTFYLFDRELYTLSIFHYDGFFLQVLHSIDKGTKLIQIKAEIQNEMGKSKSIHAILNLHFPERKNAKRCNLR